MSGPAASATSLYDTVVLRDILSFIAPGAVVLVSLYYAATPALVSVEDIISKVTSMPWPFFLIIAALAYIIGFAFQCLLEQVGLVTHYSGNLYVNDRDYYKTGLIPFLRKSSETERQIYDRFIIFMQMSINGALACFIAGILFLAKYFQYTAYLSNLLIAAGLLFLGGLLVIGFEKLKSEHEDWREAVNETMKAQ
jgi:undecaprenyl pyrophosphate phosphatase UppP